MPQFVLIGYIKMFWVQMAPHSLEEVIPFLNPHVKADDDDYVLVICPTTHLSKQSIHQTHIVIFAEHLLFPMWKYISVIKISGLSILCG